MPGTWQPADLPSLNDENCAITSPVTGHYNCIAWAAGEDFRWWWPDPLFIGYWPAAPVPREVTLAAFEAAYATLGYTAAGTRPSRKVSRRSYSSASATGPATQSPLTRQDNFNLAAGPASSDSWRILLTQPAIT
jgi:hypothetical protein